MGRGACFVSQSGEAYVSTWKPPRTVGLGNYVSEAHGMALQPFCFSFVLPNGHVVVTVESMLPRHALCCAGPFELETGDIQSRKGGQGQGQGSMSVVRL